MSPELQNAFRYHMRNNRPAFYHAQGYNGRNAWPEKANGIAAESLIRARRDVAAGTRRYPGPVRVIHASTTATGLRLVGRVVPDTERGNIWDSRGDCGWHTDPSGDVFKDGSGLCFGVVYQLAGRDGHARFVAGYEFGGVDGGPTLDLDNVTHEFVRGDETSPQDLAGAQKAARHADCLAKVAAETEREYQTAWRAGANWSDLLQEEQSDRAELLQLLSERKRQIRGAAWTSGSEEFAPAICRVIEREARRLYARIMESRAERRELASGDSGDLIFWTGETRLQEAFCEGAGLQVFPC